MLRKPKASDRVWDLEQVFKKCSKESNLEDLEFIEAEVKTWIGPLLISSGGHYATLDRT